MECTFRIGLCCGHQFMIRFAEQAEAHARNHGPLSITRMALNDVNAQWAIVYLIAILVGDLPT